MEQRLVLVLAGSLADPSPDQDDIPSELKYEQSPLVTELSSQFLYDSRIWRRVAEFLHTDYALDPSVRTVTEPLRVGGYWGGVADDVQETHGDQEGKEGRGGQEEQAEDEGRVDDAQANEQAEAEHAEEEQDDEQSTKRLRIQ